MKTPPPVSVSVSSHGVEAKATLAWDASYGECLDAFAGLMVALGFPHALQDICNERADMNELLDMSAEDACFGV